ncbi:hypothetical protein DHEL01_v209180 [Diaporthe helianthi]|uniref:GA4 desaturase n=1 Tax=Diaporthe helianthi TaxID=158607 RepID=A0A2P5HQ89_DIAHE|nr:hypothetical protein DHEL01_v209180 [Diaporthe helianthi]
MAITKDGPEEHVRTTRANLKYLLDGPKINRRFVSAGVEVNTGRYGPYETTIRDGRDIKTHFSLDRHGFQLLDAPTRIADFHDKTEVEARYQDEVRDHVQRAFVGATFVVPTGWMIRTSGEIPPPKPPTNGDGGGPYRHHGGVQPPAGEVHVDTEPSRQLAYAQRLYDKERPGGPGFRRFIISSFWRTFSPPPQACPLALCDAGSVADDEGVPNTLWVVDRIPEGDEMFADMDDETQLAAAIFRHSPGHRWWYFSGMSRDEAILLKFHDSDRGVGWRTPHTAFWDGSFADANVRESIECRSVAFFE